MRTIAAGKFKANCLAIMDEVQKKRETDPHHQAR